MNTTKKKKDSHFISIKPELLFDLDKNFKSEFTPWVYLYLKLKFNYYVTKAPQVYYKLDLKEIRYKFNISSDTVYRIINELIEFGLIEKQNGKYRLKDEAPFFEETIVAPEDKILEYMKIYFNDFESNLESIKAAWVMPVKNREMILKSLRVYYYLILKNSHCLLDEYEVESEETQSSLQRKLKHDNRTIKAILEVLQACGLVEVMHGVIITLNPRKENYSESKYSFENIDKCTSEVKSVIINKPEKKDIYIQGKDGHGLRDFTINKTKGIEHGRFYNKSKRAYLYSKLLEYPEYYITQHEDAQFHRFNEEEVCYEPVRLPEELKMTLLTKLSECERRKYD